MEMCLMLFILHFLCGPSIQAVVTPLSSWWNRQNFHLQKILFIYDWNFSLRFCDHLHYFFTENV